MKAHNGLDLRDKAIADGHARGKAPHTTPRRHESFAAAGLILSRPKAVSKDRRVQSTRSAERGREP